MSVSAMVLCAGLGTRLRPLSDLRAKALVPVGDRAALAHVLERIAAAGVARVAVNVHHRAGEVHAWLRAHAPAVGVSEEAELLGTAGGVARARARGLLGEGSGVLVWNGDILADVEVAALVEAAAATGADAALAVRPGPRGEGNVGVDAGGRIVRLRGEAVAPEAAGGEFLGVHVLGARLCAAGALPERGCLVGDAYLPALRAGARLRAVTHDAPFFDVGSPRGYLDANLAWLAARGLARWVAEDARVADGIALDRAIVGAGAVVEGRGAIERCVVWPGARARAPLADAVVAGETVVAVGVATRTPGS